MKARYKRPIPKDIKEAVKQAVAKEMDDRKLEQNRVITRTVKMACVILNQDFGFGGKRLEKFLDELLIASNAVFEKPENWYHVDEKLKALGFDFADEDIDEREQHTRDIYHENKRKFRE
jgi:hypothetical protein